MKEPPISRRDFIQKTALATGGVAQFKKLKRLTNIRNERDIFLNQDPGHPGNHSIQT